MNATDKYIVTVGAKVYGFKTKKAARAFGMTERRAGRPAFMFDRASYLKFVAVFQ